MILKIKPAEQKKYNNNKDINNKTKNHSNNNDTTKIKFTEILQILYSLVLIKLFASIAHGQGTLTQHTNSFLPIHAANVS